ncbi:MAG TPA: ARMT1-like domain-containing protein [Aggregatilinea sp.]|uniref:ARMT1-like domain-containing protein n=1 Tax=Aggregatilinea sp. TaxID=2806333 RepID=UPI002CCE12AC|nr:ARMT1-like domain-containing protein [Aggregatilinea sp.]HML22385.1 ARMT1-like domain-containing protein [Aggregatilinea sp.]
MSNSVLDRIRPLRTDNDFARDTMTRRVPGILREVQAVNPDYPPEIVQAIERLRTALVDDEPIAMLDLLPAPPPDYVDWLVTWRAQNKRSPRMTWQGAEWFFTETYLYRCLMQAIRWTETGRDPFVPIKRREMQSERLIQLVTAALDVQGSFAEKLGLMLAFDLWGNRIDLSHPASDLADKAADEDDLLVDDREAVIELLRPDGPRAAGAIHVVTDNAGSELALDLVLLDLLVTGSGSPVVLHVKPHPTYVSDAVAADIWATIDVFEAAGGSPAALARRLRAAWQAGQWSMTTHHLWASARYLWEMPPTLHEAFEQGRLLILKGDVNYRRLTGDTVWSNDVSFADVVGGLPLPVLALRSLKCDVAVGLPPRAAQLDANMPGWRVTGQYGVIQFARNDPPRR